MEEETSNDVIGNQQFEGPEYRACLYAYISALVMYFGLYFAVDAILVKVLQTDYGFRFLVPQLSIGVIAALVGAVLGSKLRLSITNTTALFRLKNNRTA